MRTSSVLLAAALTAVALPATAQTSLKAPFGPPEQHRLDNGMNVVVQEDHRTPLVSLRLLYSGGGAAAPAGLDAVARLTTSMMVRATEHVAAGEYYRLLSRAGASGATDQTSSDSISFTVTLSASQLALPLWLWSDQMGFFRGALDDAQLANARDTLARQLQLALDGSPLGRVDRMADEEMYPAGHPYRREVLVPEGVEHVDHAAVVAYHDRWITPSHATLVIVGDVVAADALSLVSRYFASIPSGTVERIKPPAAVVLTGETQIDVAADVPRPQVSIRWPTPRLYTTEDARLDVVARVLKGVRTARLFWSLVDDAKVAVGVGARERSYAMASHFEVTIEGAAGRSPAELLTAFDSAMDAIRTRPPTQKQLNDAAYETVIDRLMSYETQRVRAYEMATFTALLGTPTFIAHDMEHYEGISPTILTETIDKWLPRDRRIVMMVTPTPGAPAAGERKGRRFVAVKAP
jgi:zinc protease